MDDARLFYPATQRNRDVIYDVLTDLMGPAAEIFEVASGSGEHITHLASRRSDVVFYPSDITEDCLASIKAWRSHEGLSNIQDPVIFDVMQTPHTQPAYDGVLCINMIHISPFECTTGVMAHAGHMLRSGGFLYLYGPFKINGQHTSESNIDFEGWLKSKDERFGVRDMSEVSEIAALHGLSLENKIPMPANNFSVVFRKD